MGEEHSKQLKKIQNPPNEVKTEPQNESPPENQQPKINEDTINNNNLNNINFPGVTGGNNSKIEKPSIKENKSLNIDLDIKSVDNRRYRRFNRVVNKKANNNQKNNMVNKLEKKKNLNIDTNQNNNDIKIDPMMMTADNFHSKKIAFPKNEDQNKKLEVKKNIITNKKEEDIKKNNSPIKNVMQNFRNNNINNNDYNINKNLISNRKVKPRKLNLNIQKNEINDYKIENYNTINNEENQISMNRRHNQILQRAIMKKPENPKINIDDNINNQNKNKLTNEIKKNEEQDDINENININNEIKNNNNLNINEEIKKNEIKEEENLDLNININNLIENKQNKNNNKNIETESNQILPQRRMRRYNSYSNLNFDCITPQKVFLFENYNIFDSIMVILSNNTYIKKYFTKNQSKIYNCEKNTKYCLSIILYYISKYLWTKKPELIIKKNDLNLKYREFLNCYLEQNCKNSNPELYLYNTDNLEVLIYFIYYKINIEITAEHKNQQLFNFGTGNSLLNQFMNNFMKNNKSVISDFFTGFYQEEFICVNCKVRRERYGNIYIPFKKYSSFNYIYLDLGNNGNQYANQYGGYNTTRRNLSYCEYGNSYNQYNNMNFTINNNIYNCLNQEFNKTFQSACNLCQLNTQNYLQKQFYSLPKVLTIIINNKNANFIINDQINLSQFTHIQGNNNYYLIAMICKYTYNKQLITYCFNPKDGNWYYYTKIEGLFSKNIKKATFLEPNAIPYVLVYQDTENMDFEYNEINLEIANNKKGYLFRFQNGIPPVTLYFGINANVKEVTKAITSYFKLEKVRLIISANQLKDNDILSEVAENNASILVITV